MTKLLMIMRHGNKRVYM